MNRPIERRLVVASGGDVDAASQAALRAARRAGFSVMRQFCVAGLVSELGRDLVNRSGRALLLLRDESDGDQARLRLVWQGTGGAQTAAVPPDPGSAAAWLARWRLGELAVETDDDSARLTVALAQPKTLN